MKLFTPVRKVTFGIVMVTVSLLLLAELMGLVPSEHRGFLEGRKMLCESFAVQFSIALGKRDLALVRATLDNLIERDGDILSAAVVTNNGRQLLKSGDHAMHWYDVPLGQSSVTHVQVPIFEGGKRWGSIQVAFDELPTSSIPFSFGYPLLPLIVFMTIVGFIAYLLFIKRTLKELDPGSVIPERVKSAFDALAEGLVIMDEKEHIILANTSFSERIESTPSQLIGRKISSVGWQQDEDGLPWKSTLTDNVSKTGTLIRFETQRSGARTFTVNTTPITGPNGKVRGVLATFADLTDLERKRNELGQTVEALQKSRRKLQEKTVELEFLATRDSLTGCLNRRAFFDKTEFLFMDAAQNDKPLACVMTDIDHFKLVNDTHGHAMGDKVIQLVSGQLRAHARPDDLIGRYGGEEFCIMLPGVEIDAAVAIAERLRTTIKDVSHKNFGAPLRVTASFGVAVFDNMIKSPAELVSLADKALYLAKEGGRNRVVAWRGDETAEVNVVATGDELAVVSVAPEEATAFVDDVADGRSETGSLQERIAELEAQLAYSEQSHSGELGHDDVTGLPNRMLLMDRIRQATARSERFDRVSAVIVLDIDLFRRINDALGFVIGDKVLCKSGERLLEILRQTDTVALLGCDATGATVSRTGADEFGILIDDLADADAVTWIVKRLLDFMSEPLNIDGNEIFISCSAGISLFPHDSDDPEQLLRHASAARYNAKQRLGRNNFAFFSEDLNHVSYRHLWLEGQMHNALANGEFSLHYQPKVDFTTGRINGMEGLLRWNNPKIGAISPVDFIPVAEHTGVINEIGRWVLRTGCEQARQWAEAGFTDVAIAVNVSPLQFRQKDLFEQIMTSMEEAGLPSGILEIEVTETVIMENLSDALETLNRLAKAGVHIAIDDFGTGYSSLSYLKHLPVTTLKIDRSFLSDTVPDEQDKLIMTAIIAMAHSMRLRVVAEGVETEAQRDFLKNLQCDEMQGYLFSKPVCAEETLELLKRHNTDIPEGLRARKIA